jgi:hypothetical protein
MSASKKKKAERTVGARPKSSGRPSETRADSGHTEPGRKDTRISAKRTGRAAQPSLVSTGGADPAAEVKAVELVQSRQLGEHRDNGRDGAVTVALSAAARGNPPALPVPIATFTV